MKLVTMPVSQYDPRQQVCWDYYINPDSPTFGSVAKSAVRAGYPEISCHSIYGSRWFRSRKEQLMRKGILLSDAERVLLKTLKYKTDREVEEKGEKIRKVNVSLLSVQVEAAKHVTKTLGKDQGWAERVEQTGKNGSALPIPIINVLINNGHTQNNGATEAGQGSAGGNLSEQDGIDSLVADSSSTE